MANRVVEGRGLTLWFPPRGRGPVGPSQENWPAERASAVSALQGVSLAVGEGEVVAVVGASGSGKSSLLRLLACLQPPSAGEVWWQGMRVDHLSEARRRRLRHLVQMVFQEPGGSFNPRHSVGFALREALRRRVQVAGDQGKENLLEEQLRQLLERVDLPASQDFLARRIDQFSGGQRQRLALARALAVQPKALLLDEPVASLDLPLRRQFMSWLAQLVGGASLAVLLVTHDMSILQGLATRVAVLLAGKIVEEGPWEAVRDDPRHPYTRALLQASQRGYHLPRFFIPSPSGCAFRLACPQASAACEQQPGVCQEAARSWACFHPLRKNFPQENFVQAQGEGG
ncbi:MAG: ATP-binding cassette domain-containing protein [Thermoanaerobaculum sp.]|nr:ATP-binding cassette domain-containing protein [Thermoanaerobaculum sp.]MDW7967630.1 ATP-binding cassette domain-containing protein [Thermoanaerobaculum sp.]